MPTVRHIALLLAMAFVTIAVSLTPSTALAHGGRVHDGRAHAVAPQSVQAAQLASAPLATIRAVVEIGCTDPCCAAGGHHGSCCCATGLAPAAVAATLPPRSSARTRAHEHASPDGIVPEALPEPPRPFA